MQRTNCNLQLSLDLGSSSNKPKSSGEESLESSTATMDQPFAIFFKGLLCDFDVTDFRAKAIIWCASRETDERSSPILSPSPQFQLCSPPGSSVKRSLQKFLQERKNRIRATSPYKYPSPPSTESMLS
ncbi:CO/COL/TOC1, conserved site [Dillenia turbinata]|uniref:CO/COL/TOC1, conserved site n=1 Tax=Dillenia turbinata TaxID=194707 RepID=A0AAN8YYG6_9MAGN